MLIVAVSYYPHRRTALPADWQVWETTKPIPHTYSEVATHAVSEGWDTDTIVIQDDVRLLEQPAHDGPLVVYGQGDADHVCPRAFAASPEVWVELSRRWQPWTGQICQTWKPLVDRVGTVLNVTEHLEPTHG